MLKYLVWVVRDLLAAGILISVMYGLATCVQNLVQKKSISFGLLIGTVFSVLLAFLKGNAIIRKYQYVILYVSLFILIFGIAYLVFVFLPIKKKSSLIEIIFGSVSGVFVCVLLLSVVPDFLLYPFGFRLIGETIVSTDFLFKVISFLGGSLLVFLTCLCAYKISSKHSELFAKITVTVLSVLTFVNYYGKLLNAMNGRKIIKLRRGTFSLAFVRWDLNHQRFFVFASLIVILVLAILLVWKSFHNTEHYENSAEHRKIRAKCRNQRRWAVAFLIFAILIFIDQTVLKSITEKTVSLSEAEPFELVENKVYIPLESVSDGNLHRFEWVTDDDVGIRFIIIQKNAFAFGVGFDACEICGATGYYQKNGQVICKLCEVVMNINTIGYKGGCNPIPLPYSIDSGNIIIDTSDLLVEKRRFR